MEETPREEEPQTETNDLIAGRIYRKRTMPSPVQAPRKSICRTVVYPVPGGVTVETQTDTVVIGMADKSTHTAGYRKRVKEVTITKYHENDRSVENIVEREKGVLQYVNKLIFETLYRTVQTDSLKIKIHLDLMLFVVCFKDWKGELKFKFHLVWIRPIKQCIYHFFHILCFLLIKFFVISF